MFPAGHDFTFTSPYQQHWERNGQHAVVLGELPAAPKLYDYDREEVGPLFRIRFDDGVEISAWPEEIDPSLIVGAG